MFGTRTILEFWTMVKGYWRGSKPESDVNLLQVVGPRQRPGGDPF